MAFSRLTAGVRNVALTADVTPIMLATSSCPFVAWQQYLTTASGPADPVIIIINLLN